MPHALRWPRSRSFRSTAIALLCILLPGCATYRAAYETRLISSLPNQRGVSIEESRAFPGDMLCGRYTSFNGPDFSLATQDFVVTPPRSLRQCHGLAALGVPRVPTPGPWLALQSA